MNIEHDVERSLFTAVIDEPVGTLSYSKPAEGVLDLQSTVVNPAYRRRGIGAQLVRRALGYAEENGAKVVPSCWFVAQFMDRNPQYSALRQGE